MTYWYIAGFAIFELKEILLNLLDEGQENLFLYPLLLRQFPLPRLSKDLFLQDFLLNNIGHY